MTVPADARLRVIDSHTAGEPTRVVVSGAEAYLSTADDASDPVAVRATLAQHHDWIRTALTLEPRGAPWMVGALLTAPSRDDTAAGVVFFNNAGYLGMCGHGVMGVVATLASLGRIEPGVCRLDTPAGPVTATLHDDCSVSFDNVPARRSQHTVTLDTPDVGRVTGDIAYGGNWFFLASADDLMTAGLDTLLERTRRIKSALWDQGFRGDNNARIDHVELIGRPPDPLRADAQNFVLCPGGEYDRSPCGTGVSAKLACLAAEGRLEPGAIWRQQSLLGGIFEATYRWSDEHRTAIVPTIRGRAHITGETIVTFDPADPHTAGFTGPLH